MVICSVIIGYQGDPEICDIQTAGSDMKKRPQELPAGDQAGQGCFYQ